jgi:protein TonB
MDGLAGTSARAPDAAVLCALAVSVAVHAAVLMLPSGPLRAPEPARPPVPMAVRIAPPPDVEPPRPLPVAMPRPPVPRSVPAAPSAPAADPPAPPRTLAPSSAPPSLPASAAPAAATGAPVVAPTPAVPDSRTATPVVAAGASATAATAAPSAVASAPARPGPPAATSPPGFDADYLHNPPPRYPPAAQRLRESGRVLLAVQVSASGLPERVEVSTSSGSPRLDQAALETVRRWRFIPAQQAGKPVAAGVIVPIVFRLDD